MILAACSIVLTVAATCSSNETSAEDARCSYVADGLASTFWHSSWSGSSVPSHPHRVTLDLGGVHEVCGIRLTPRQDGSTNGTPGAFRVLRMDGEAAEAITPVLAMSGGGGKAPETFWFQPAPTRTLRLDLLSEYRPGRPWAALAEVEVLAEVSACDPTEGGRWSERGALTPTFRADPSPADFDAVVVILDGEEAAVLPCSWLPAEPPGTTVRWCPGIDPGPDIAVQRHHGLEPGAVHELRLAFGRGAERGPPSEPVSWCVPPVLVLP